MGKLGPSSVISSLKVDAIPTPFISLQFLDNAGHTQGAQEELHPLIVWVIDEGRCV